MSTDEKKTVNVTILDKPYQVALTIGEHVALTASARYLDEHMRAIRKTGKVVGLERIAVMAALNLAHDLIRSEQSAQVGEESSHLLQSMNSKLSSALSDLNG